MNRISLLSGAKVVYTTMIVALVLSACGPATTAPTPQTIEVTRIVAGTPVVEQVVVTTTPEAAQPEPVTVTWATIAGFYTDWAKEVAKEWEQKTGNKVNIIDVDLPTMYEKIVLEAVGQTGAYDIVTWDVGWKSEWAYNGYLRVLDDYIKNSDPNELQLEDISPIR